MAAKKTRIVVHANAQLAKLYLRGEGMEGLSWEKGVEMNRQQADEWVFETNEPFASGSFKVLIDDQTYELGENHPIYPGTSVRINPKFPKGD